MNHIYFLNEGLFSFLFGNKEKNKIIENYSEYDLKIRKCLAILEYKLEKIYTPILDSSDFLITVEDDNENEMLKYPGKIATNILKAYNAKGSIDKNNISSKLIISEEILNKIDYDIENEPSNIYSKNDMANALESIYSNRLNNIYQNYFKLLKYDLVDCDAVYEGSGNKPLTINMKRGISADIINCFINNFINDIKSIEGISKQYCIKFKQNIDHDISDAISDIGFMND